MIRASRTPMQEQPDGSMTCTITIPRSSVIEFLDFDEAAVVITREPMPKRYTGEDILRRSAELSALVDDEPEPVPEPPSDAEDFSVNLQAETAAEKPPTQGIGVDGFETAKVVEAVTSGGVQWNHPAAPYLKEIYRHEPFQKFAMWRLKADPFAGPMECATRLIVKATKDRPQDVALSSLGRKMDTYMEWASAQGMPMWPEKKA